MVESGNLDVTCTFLGESTSEFDIEGVHLFFAVVIEGDSTLVGDNDEPKPGIGGAGKGGSGAGCELKLIESVGVRGVDVEDAVAVEKKCRFHEDRERRKRVG